MDLKTLIYALLLATTVLLLTTNFALIAECADESVSEAAVESGKRAFDEMFESLSPEQREMMLEFSDDFPENHESGQMDDTRMFIVGTIGYIRKVMKRWKETGDIKGKSGRTYELIFSPIMQLINLIKLYYGDKIETASQVLHKLEGSRHKILLALNTPRIFVHDRLLQYLTCDPQNLMDASSKLSKFFEFLQSDKNFDVFRSTRDEMKDMISQFIMTRTKFACRLGICGSKLQEETTDLSQQCRLLNATRDSKYVDAAAIVGIGILQYKQQTYNSCLNLAQTCFLIRMAHDGYVRKEG